MADNMDTDKSPDWDNVIQPEDRPELQQPAPKRAKRHSPKPGLVLSHTVTKPPSAYAQLELITADSAQAQPFGSVAPDKENTPMSGSANPTIDALELRGYLTSALTHFLGASGSAMAVDVLRIRGAEAWVRISREDLPAFAAAVAAWPGTSREGKAVALRVRAAGNWLGSLLGRSEQKSLWG